MTVPTARDMADRLYRAMVKLHDASILQPEALSVAFGIQSQLRRSGNVRSWAYSVGREMPITFAMTRDKNGDQIIPSISVERIAVDENVVPIPFISWNIALEVRYQETRLLCARWHFDYANEDQPGPALHLQYGGHVHEDRRQDANLSEPRWNFPVMDIVLLSETVAANFYHEQWLGLREDPNWCECVHQSQELCLSAYLTRINDVRQFRTNTILNEMWNDRWR